jgi:hypothetical protein
MMLFAHYLFFMLAGHAYADFALQNPYHSSIKYPGNEYNYPWWVALICHSFIHGGIVGIVTGIWWLGAAETIHHATTDWIKGRRWIGSTADQISHVIAKIVWALIALDPALQN